MWLTTGLAIGLFVAFLVYLSAAQNKAASPTPSARLAAPVERVTTKAPEQKAETRVEETPDTPRYDFYAILPQKKIEITSTDLAADRGGSGSQTRRGPWMLQAGSFRNYGDADRLRANLAFQGLESKIDLSTNDAGTWHRVRLGPFESRREADRIKSRLARSNIDSLILQVRP
jgi:cell division protein FtsN